jgi:hypothetical protein
MNLFACSWDPHTLGWLAGAMAEQSSPFPALYRPGRGPSRPLSVIAVIVLASAGLGGAQSPPPALEPDRARLVRIRAQARALASVPVGKLGRRVRLRSVLPAIRRTPSSRPDTPALPTVGRPRDGPRSADVPGRPRHGFLSRSSLALGSSFDGSDFVAGAICPPALAFLHFPSRRSGAPPQSSDRADKGGGAVRPAAF